MEVSQNQASNGGNRKHANRAKSPSVPAPEIQYMTVIEAANYLRLKPQTLYRWAADGKIPFHKLHRSIRFIKSELDAWVGKQIKPRFD
jgi:excisionase family DNA binding protein